MSQPAVLRQARDWKKTISESAQAQGWIDVVSKKDEVEDQYVL